MKKWLLMIIALLSIVVLVACGGNDDNDDGGQANDPTTDLEGLEPDLEGIPDIIASINGEEITREEFETVYLNQFPQHAFQAQLQGQPLDQNLLKKDTVEGLIAQRLLIQESERRDFETTDDDVQELIDELVAANELESQEILFEQLEEQGTSENEFRDIVRSQIKLDKLLADETKDISITEEDIKETYERLVEMYADAEEDVELPVFDDMRDQLESELVYLEENEIMLSLIERLHEEGEVENHM